MLRSARRAILHTFCDGLARAARRFCTKIARFWPSKNAFPGAERAAKSQRARFKTSPTLPKRARRTPSDLAHVLQWFRARRAVVLQRNRAIGRIKIGGVRNFKGTAKQCPKFRHFWKSARRVFASFPPGNNVEDICDVDCSRSPLSVELIPHLRGAFSNI